MKGWRTAMAVGLVFAAQTALADQAKARGSGSSGSSKPSGSSGSHASSTAGGRHPSSPSGASSRSTDSGRAYGSSSSRSSAEQRHPRPGTGTGYRYPYGGYGHGGYGYGYPYYGYGYGYPYYGYYGFSPWYYGSSWGWGFGLGYGYGRAGAYGGYPSSYYYHDEEGSLRVLVQPDEAKVYVDGYYAGVVDDFDGTFQRLHVRPGRHQLTFKLAGYQTHRVLVYVPPEDTLKIRHSMVKGSESEETEESMVLPGTEAREQAARERYSRPELGQESEEAAEGDLDTGTVRLYVEPRDASVYIDGEFRGAGRDLRRLELPPGRHRIEIVRPGFRTLERDVAVLPGRSEDLEIRLEK